MKTLIPLENFRMQADPQYLKFLTEVNRQLLPKAGYVGVSPCGSQMKGYHTPKSDFDVFILGGNGKYKDEDGFKKDVRMIGKKFGKKADVVTVWNRSFFESNFESGFEFAYYHALWPLAYPFIGKMPEIYHLRRLGKKRHEGQKNYDRGAAEKSIQEALYSVIYWELGVYISFEQGCIVSTKFDSGNGRIGKMLDRGYTVSDIKSIAVSRADMWSRRLYRLFGADCPQPPA